MINIEQTKEKVLDKIHLALEEYSNVLLSLRSEIKVISDKVEEEKGEYNKYLKLNEELNDRILNGERDLKNRISRFEDEVEKFNNKVKGFDKKKQLIESKIKENVEYKKEIENEIKEHIKNRDSLSIFTNQKDSLIAEIDYLKQIIDENVDILNDVKAKKTVVEGEIKKIKNEAVKELDKVKKEISKAIKDAAPKINNLEKREKDVATREKSVNTVIERYKRLYEDKGAGFRV